MGEEARDIAGILPDSVKPGCESNGVVVRGRLQQLTNRQLLMRHTTQKMARPTGFEPVTPAFGGRAFVRK